MGILVTSVKQRRREEGAMESDFGWRGFRLETYLVYASLCTHAPSWKRLEGASFSVSYRCRSRRLSGLRVCGSLSHQSIHLIAVKASKVYMGLAIF